MRGRFALVLFDLDGTLIDSRRDIADAANDLLIECGGRALPEATVGRMVGDGAAALVTRAFTAAGVEPPPDALLRFLRHYDGRLTVHTRPYPGAEELLRHLRSRHALGVLTNKPIGATRQILSALSLEHHFDPALVMGGDGPLPRKPDPAGLVALAHTAGTEPVFTLLVGDSVIDSRTAHAAGATACLARYGFGFEGFPMEELWPADLIVDSPQQLVNLL
jgi:phosphoglycolate phosphatase